MKIANKISISFLTAALVLAFLGSTSFYVVAGKALRDSASDHLYAIAQARASHIETYLTTQKNAIEAQAGDVLLVNAIQGIIDRRPNAEEMLTDAKKELVSNLETDKYLLGISVLDRNGKTIISTDEKSTGLDRSEDISFQKAKDRVHFKDIYYSEKEKRKMLEISAPVFYKEKSEFLGVIVAQIDPEGLSRITTDSTGMGKTGETYLVNKDGLMITPSRFRKDTFLNQKIDSWNMRAALEHKEKDHPEEEKDTAVFIDYRGVPVLGTHQYIPQMDWFLLAEIDESEAFGPLDRVKQVFISVMILIPLAAWLTGIYVSKKITKPIYELQKGTEIIGEGNLDHKLGTDTQDEVGELSKAFDNMTGKLKNVTTSVDNLNEEISRRRTAEKTVRQQKEFTEKVIDSLEYPFYVINRDYSIALTNRTAREQGISVNSHCYEVTHSRQEPCKGECACPLEEVIRTGRSVRMEHTHKDREGNETIVEVYGDPIFDANGDVVQMIEYSIDVTDRKEAEDELKKSEASLREAQRIAHIGNWDWDIAKNELRWSDEIYRVFGLVPGEFNATYEAFLSSVHPDDREAVEEAVNNALVGKAQYEIEHRVVQPDGTERTVHEKGNVIRGENGEPVRMAGTVQDITDRKKAEERLGYFQKAVDSASDAIGMSTPEGRHYYQNAAFDKLFGLTVKEVNGETGPPSTIYADEKAGQEVFETIMKGESWIGEVKMLNRQRKELDIFLRAYSIKDAKDNVIGLIGVHTDITARRKKDRELEEAYKKLKEAQEQLIQAGKMAAMGQLAAGISHELNQPLTGVKGFAQTVLLEIDGNSPFKRDIEKIVEQANRMDNIIRHIRFFARKSDFKMTEFNVNGPINDSLTLLNEQLKIHNIRVKKHLAEGLPIIKGNPNQLEQVFLNFITNSRDAIDSLKSPDGGEITIETVLSEDRQNVEIVFSDSGGGIPEKDMEHIFNPFFTTKSPAGGMGLGLSIVYRIIEDHKGTITADNRPGEGVTFRITLPVMNADDHRYKEQQMIADGEKGEVINKEV